MDGSIPSCSPLVPQNENNLSFLCVMMYFNVNSFCDVWVPSEFWICIFMKKVLMAPKLSNLVTFSNRVVKTILLATYSALCYKSKNYQKDISPPLMHEILKVRRREEASLWERVRIPLLNGEARWSLLEFGHLFKSNS